MRLKTGEWVIVCDAGKYVVYENHGDEDLLDLRVVETAENDNAPTREQGSDKPGRYPSPGTRRAAVDNTDWHTEQKKKFIEQLADNIDDWSQNCPERHYVLVADPRSLGELRTALGASALEHVRTSINGDYVHLPVAEIEKLLSSTPDAQ